MKLKKKSEIFVVEGRDCIDEMSTYVNKKSEKWS